MNEFLRIGFEAGDQELAFHDIVAESQDLHRTLGVISGVELSKVENIALVVQVICLVTIREYSSC